MGTNLTAFSPAGAELHPEWSMRLVIDVVLGTSNKSILECHDLVHHQFEAILKNPLFVRQCDVLKKELEKDGATFKLKAQLQADFYLDRVHALIMDPKVDPRVQVKLIEDVARWAGFDAPTPVNGGGQASGFTLNFNFPGDKRPGVTIEAASE